MPLSPYRHIFRLAFALVGIGATIIPSTLEPLAQFFGIPIEAAGIFTAAFFIGATSGIFIGGMLLDRFASRPISMLGHGIFGVGLVMLALTPPQTPLVAWLCVIGIGFGYGFLVVCGNGLAPRYQPSNPARELSAVNLFFGVGAIVGPQLAPLALQAGDFRLMYMGVGAIGMGMMGVFVIMPSFLPHHRADATAAVDWFALLPFGVMFFLYVGVEIGFATWISPHMTLRLGVDAAIGTLGISLFWTGLTVGRLMTSWAVGRISPIALLMGGMGVVGMGVWLVLAWASDARLLLALSFAVGWGCAPIFPLGLAVLNARYAQAFGVVSGAMIAIGNSGAIVLPALQGWVGAGVDGGMLVPLIATGVMVMCAIVVARQPAVT